MVSNVLVSKHYNLKKGDAKMYTDDYIPYNVSSREDAITRLQLAEISMTVNKIRRRTTLLTLLALGYILKRANIIDKIREVKYTKGE